MKMPHNLHIDIKVQCCSKTEFHWRHL